MESSCDGFMKKVHRQTAFAQLENRPPDRLYHDWLDRYQPTRVTVIWDGVLLRCLYAKNYELAAQVIWDVDGVGLYDLPWLPETGESDLHSVRACLDRRDVGGRTKSASRRQ